MPSWHPPNSDSGSVQDDEYIIKVNNDAKHALVGYDHLTSGLLPDCWRLPFMLRVRTSMFYTVLYVCQVTCIYVVLSDFYKSTDFGQPVRGSQAYRFPGLHNRHGACSIPSCFYTGWRETQYYSENLSASRCDWPLRRMGYRRSIQKESPRRNEAPTTHNDSVRLSLLTDHHLIVCKLVSNKPRPIRNEIIYRNISAIDMQNFARDLLDAPLVTTPACDIETLCDQYNSQLLVLIIFTENEEKCPTSWMQMAPHATSGTPSNVHLHETFKQSISSAKSDYCCANIESSSGNTKEMYHITNNLMGHTRQTVLPKCDGGPSELAESFVTFFIAKIVDICSRLNSTSTLSPYIDVIPSTLPLWTRKAGIPAATWKSIDPKGRYTVFHVFLFVYKCHSNYMSNHGAPNNQPRPARDIHVSGVTIVWQVRVVHCHKFHQHASLPIRLWTRFLRMTANTSMHPTTETVVTSRVK